MRSIQSELQAAFPQALEQIRKEARKAAFERAAEKGKGLLLAATQATVEGHLVVALRSVQRDRYACAAYLARELTRQGECFVPVRSRNGEQSGFSELEMMENLWCEKIQEQNAATAAKLKQELDQVGIA